MIRHNFNRHYLTNKAPLSLSFDSSWLTGNPGFARELANWMDEVLTEHNDVYFVTELEVLKWMWTPTDLAGLRDFVDWQEKCDVKGQPLCSLSNPCPLTTRELPGETLRLHTCMQCPANYPWILDPTGDGFNF